MDCRHKCQLALFAHVAGIPHPHRALDAETVLADIPFLCCQEGCPRPHRVLPRMCVRWTTCSALSSLLPDALVDKTKGCRVLQQRSDLSTIQSARRFCVDFEPDRNIAALYRRQLLDDCLDNLVNVACRSLRRNHHRAGEPGRISIRSRWRRHYCTAAITFGTNRRPRVFASAAIPTILYLFGPRCLCCFRSDDYGISVNDDLRVIRLV